MKQSISAPIAGVLALAVVGVLGFFLYKHFLAGPPTDWSHGNAAKMGGPPANMPRSKEEGMRMFRGGQIGKPSTP